VRRARGARRATGAGAAAGGADPRRLRPEGDPRTVTVSAPQAPPYGLGRTRLPAWPERARDPSRLLLAPLPTMPLIARERPRRPRTRSMHALDRTAGPNDHEQPSASAPDLPLIARDGRDDHERPRRPSHDPDR